MILVKFMFLMTSVALALSLALEIVFGNTAHPFVFYAYPTPRWQFYFAIFASLAVGFALAYYLCFARVRFYGVPTR
jgi:hypothetical protein